MDSDEESDDQNKVDHGCDDVHEMKSFDAAAWGMGHKVKEFFHDLPEILSLEKSLVIVDVVEEKFDF